MRCSGMSSDEELIHWLLRGCVLWWHLSISPALHHWPFAGALSCCLSPAVTALLGYICTTGRAPRPGGALRQMFGQVLGQTIPRWSPDSCRSLRAESQQKVYGGRVSYCFDGCVRMCEWDRDSRVHVGLWLLFILFQKEIGERAGDGGAQRRVGVVSGWEWCRAAALGRVTGASWRGAAAASRSQALCSTPSSMKLLQEGVTAQLVA